MENTVNIPVPAPRLRNSLTHGVVAIAKTARRRVSYWRNVRATQRELDALSDGLLRDIGLHRGEITAYAHAYAAQKVD